MYNYKGWCSILVSFANSEGGPKNPSKSVSMKFFAIASDAQSGVIVGSKEDGAIHNGMWAMTLPLWRLFLWKRITYVLAQAICSVACLERDRWKIMKVLRFRPKIKNYVIETYFAKEDKD